MKLDFVVVDTCSRPLEMDQIVARTSAGTMGLTSNMSSGEVSVNVCENSLFVQVPAFSGCVSVGQVGRHTVG